MAINIIQFCPATVERLRKDEPRGLEVVVVTHPGGHWSGEKNYRMLTRDGAVAIEVAAPDDTAGRRAAWKWIRGHNIKVRKKSYRQQ